MQCNSVIVQSAMQIDPFTLTIETGQAKKYQVFCVGYQNTIEYVKQVLQRQSGIAVSRINLVMGSVELQNDMTLQHYGIDKTSRIALIVGISSGRHFHPV